MSRKYNLTRKQRIILEIICRGNQNEEGATISWLDLDQLLGRVPYYGRKQAMQFALRYLERKSMLEPGRREIRRSKRRRILVPTDLGYSKVNLAPAERSYEEDDVIVTF